MRVYLLIVAILLVAGGANAASREIQYRPAASWVIAPPTMTPTAAAAPPGAPVRIIYMESQVRLGSDGDETYTAYRMSILKPEALSIGNVTATWSPNTDDFIVHRLNIIRGGKVIDVLKTEKFKVIQRENYLDYAMLNGDLTATLQTRGLQVGDEIEFAATTRRKDPTLGDRSQGAMQLPIVGMPGAYRARLSWPRTKTLRWRATADLGELTPTTDGDQYVLNYEMRDPKSAILTDGAPARFNVRRALQFSGFENWTEVSQLLWPLFDKAAKLSPESPLHAEAAKIAAATKDPVERTEAALQLVQDRIRYVYVGLDDSNYRPASADETWKRRFGDCKAKTALLIALLRELGVEAEAALVNSSGGDGIDQRLPFVAAFDHVIVRATVGGKVYWLDGTRLGDRKLTSLPPLPFAWSLPLRMGPSDLVAIKPEAPIFPQSSSVVEIDARSGFEAPAKVKAEQVLRGDAAAVLRTGFGALSEEDVDRGLKAYWRNERNWAEPETVTWRYDELSRVLVLTMTGEGKPDWEGDDFKILDIDGAGFSSPNPLRRPKEQDQSAPWRTNFPKYSRWTTIIRLPPAKGAWRWAYSASQVDEQLGGVAYWRDASLADDVMRTTMSRRTFAAEISPTDASALNDRLPKFDNKVSRVFQTAGSASAPTKADPALLAAAEASGDVDRLLQAAAYYLVNRRYDDALRTCDKAIKVDPSNLKALAFKALVLRQKGDEPGSLAFLEKVIRTRPDPELQGMRAGLLIRAGRKAEALEVLEKLPDTLNPKVFEGVVRVALEAGSKERAASLIAAALKADPSMAEAWFYRGALELNSGHADKAVASLAEAIKLRPEGVAAWREHAQALRKLNRLDEAQASIDEAWRMNPLDTYTLVIRSGILARAGRTDEAWAPYEDWVATDKTGYALNARCWQRGLLNVDLAKAEADCAAAVKLTPKASAYWDSYALIALRDGRLTDALQRYDQALTLTPKMSQALYGRGLVKLRSGDERGGQADIDAAKALNPEVAEELTEAGVTPSMGGLRPGQDRGLDRGG